MARLSIQDPAGNERVVELEAAECVIGRGAGAGLILNDKHASRLHARISRESSHFVITDLNSGNGLYVNEERVKQKVLSDQDVIRVGYSRLLFQESGSSNDVRFSDFDPGDGKVLIRRVEDAAPSVGVPAAGGAAKEQELEGLRKKARILTLMYELGRTLKGAFSRDQIYSQVSLLLLEVCAADRVLILQSEDSGEVLRLAHRADAGNGPTDRYRPVSRTITRKVMSERVTLLSSNAAVDPALAAGQSIVLQQIRSVICAPLMVRDEAKGVIYLDQEKVAAFTHEDLDVVNAVAAQAAIVLENVVALERLTREAEARAAYSRFLPAHVVEDLLHNPQSLKLGGVNQVATILFTDIRGFTRLSSRLEPEAIVAILNEYFSEMTDVIFQHGGTLDKYIGDGLMALFGAPYAGPDDPVNAVRAAVAMQERLEILKEQLHPAEAAWSHVNIGIGIDTGLVTVGYVGSSRRLDYTAIGDTVNMASRLESNAPPGAIYISQSTYEGLRGQFPCRQLQINVKGKDLPIDCYQVLRELPHGRGSESTLPIRAP